MISKNQLKKFLRDGLSDLEISAKTGESKKVVFNARKKYGLLTDEEMASIFKTRRKIIKGGLITFALIGVGGAIGGVVYESKRPITYEDALRDERKRQTHIEHIVRGKIPPYVLSVRYATPRLLEELAKHDYVPSKEVFADTIPVEMIEKDETWEPIKPEQIGKGAKSIIVIYNSVYDWYAKFPELERKYPRSELYKDMEIVLKNVLLRNEFTDAKHFSLGIEGYPIESFKDSNGNVNYRLFNMVTDLLSNAEEYKGVIAEPRTSKSQYLQYYTDGLKKMVVAHHILLSDPQLTRNMDMDFMQRL